MGSDRVLQWFWTKLNHNLSRNSFFGSDYCEPAPSFAFEISWISVVSRTKQTYKRWNINLSESYTLSTLSEHLKNASYRGSGSCRSSLGFHRSCRWNQHRRKREGETDAKFLLLCFYCDCPFIGFLDYSSSGLFRRTCSSSLPSEQ